jgi:undecaprenyl-diphosphatase
LSFFNEGSQSSYVFDKAIEVVTANHLLKGGVLLGLLWWSWTRRDGALIDRHLTSVRTIIGALLAVAVARGLQNLLPYRPRPLHNPELGFLPPFGIETLDLDGWSSFPSDHAVLFFALSTALWLASRPVGLFAFFWSTVVICLPRIYAGYHYPTDILAGAVVGVLVMLAVMRMPIRERMAGLIGRVETAYPGWFHAVFFLVTFQMATLFENARRLIAATIKTIGIA